MAVKDIGGVTPQRVVSAAPVHVIETDSTGDDVQSLFTVDQVVAERSLEKVTGVAPREAVGPGAAADPSLPPRPLISSFPPKPTITSQNRPFP